MKLHLPKQLFTALLAAITLAAPATLTLGSSVGAADELGIVKEGNFWANDYTYSFMLQDDAFTNVIADANGAKTIVLSRYYGSTETGDLGSNALIAVQDSAGTITLKLGRGKYTSASDSFSLDSNNCVSFDSDVTVKTGVVYTLKVAGATGSMTPTLYGIAAGESDTQSSYNGNMNGDATMQSVFNDDAAILISGSSFVASDDSNTNNVVEGTASLVENNTLVWAGTPAEGAAAWTAESTTWNNISGSANGVAAGAANDVIFDASSATSKTLNLEGALAVNSISVYGDYTFNATAATTLSTTEGLSIAGGKTLTLQGATITLGGTITNNGTLNMAGFTVAANTTTTFGGSGTTTLSGTVTNNGTLNLVGLTVASDNLAVTNTGLVNLAGLSKGTNDGDHNFDTNTKQYTSLINAISGGEVLLSGSATAAANLTLQLGHNSTPGPSEVNFNADYTSYGDLTLANWSATTTWTVKDSLTVTENLAITNKQKLSIGAGASVTAGSMRLGHYDANVDGATLSMTGGMLTTGTILMRGSSSNSSVSITGGSVEFTAGNAISVGQGTPEVSIKGAADAPVILKASQADWTLDGTGLSTSSVIGNVTIAEGNTHGITLKNVNLTGSIVNNAELALGSGVTVAANDSATVTGHKVQILSTLASAGTLNLNADAIYVSETLQGYEMTDGTTAYSLDGTNIVENGDNGFKLKSGATYYLSKDGNVTTTCSEVRRNDTASYKLVSDESGLRFTVAEAVRSDEYYITSGDVTVDSAVQALATGYVVQGGNMKITEGSVSNGSISYTTGSITLDSSATITDLIAATDSTLMGNITGAGTMEVAVANNWNDTITTSADFTGTVYVKSGTRFTYDSAKLGSTLKLASGVNMQVNGGGSLTDNLVLETGSHEVHVNGGTSFDVTGSISGEGSFKKMGSSSTVYIKDNATVANYENNTGTTTVQGGEVTNLTASGGTVNVTGGTVSMLTTTGGTSNVTGGSVTTLTTTGGTSNVTGGTVTTVFSSGGTTNLSTSATGGLVVSGGTVTITGTASIGTDTGTMQVRSDASKNKGIYGHTGTINIGDGTTATTVTTNRVEMGDTDQTANGKGGTLNVNANATLVVTSDAASDAEYGSAGFLLGEWRSSSTMKVAGAVLAKDTAVVNGDQTAIINIENGGLLATKGLGRSNDQGVGVNLTLKDGGKLILGSEGITTVEGFTSTLNAGTVGIYGDSEVSITKDLTLSSATGTTFDTQKYTWTGNSAINRSEGAENGGTLTISGTLSGAGKLIKTGSGELVLSGANTYSGGTTVQEGELIVSSAGSLGTGSVQLESGSTLTLGASVTNAILVNGAGANINLSSGVTLTQNGKITINDGASINYTLDGAILNLSGTTVTSGISSIDMKNGSVVQLHSANDILGGESSRTAINMSGNSALSLKNGQGGGLVWADINVDGSGRILGSVNGDYAVVKGSIKGNGSLLLGRSDDAWNNAWKIESRISDNESGKLSVTFDATNGNNGASKVTLSGANTYSGGTTIENGHLYTENASALGTGKVTVNAGGVLSVAENLNLQDTLQLSGAGEVQVATGKSLNLQDKVSLSSTDGTNAATLTAKSDSALAQLQEDASFTIEDMTLTNTTITAATPTTQVNFSNVTVAGATVLRNMQASMTGANVSIGGSDGVKGEFTASTSLLSGITLANTDAVGSTIVVDLGDLSCAAPMDQGKYDLSITLSGFTMQDYTQGIVFAADSWLGQLLTAQGATAYVSGAVETPDSVSEGGSTGGVSVSYSAATGGNVGTVITITGLNVPEPATSTFSLMALAALAARRRRK